MAGGAARKPDAREVVSLAATALISAKNLLDLPDGRSMSTNIRNRSGSWVFVWSIWVIRGRDFGFRLLRGNLGRFGTGRL